MRSFILVLVAAALSACGNQFDLEKYKDQVDITQPRTLISTVYYIPVFSAKTSYQKCSVQGMKVVRDDTGKVLAQLCASEVKDCGLQGSCYYLNRGNLFLLSYLDENPNSTKPSEAVYLFRISKSDKLCPQGSGVKRLCLDPYRSVAADPQYHQTGEVIFVPELVGTNLPNGETHDGYFTVRDQGGRIKGRDRFDFFMGFDRPNSEHVFYKKRLSSKNSGLLYLKALPATQAKVNQERGFPSVPASVTDFAIVQLNGFTSSIETVSK